MTTAKDDAVMDAGGVRKLSIEHQMLDLVPDMVCECRFGAVQRMNAAGAAMLGFRAPEDVEGRMILFLLHPDYQPLVEDGLTSLAEAGSVPLLFRRTDGSVLEAEVHVRPIPGTDADEDAVFLHGRDITERSRAVQGVLESEQRYRSLVDLALDLICLATDGTITLVNAAGTRLLDAFEADDLVGRPVRDIIHPDYHPIVDLGLDVLAEENGLVPMKLMTLKRQAVDVELRVAPTDRPGAFMIEARDIRARLRSAEAVRERENRLQGILDTVAEAIITADERGIIQSFNKAAEKLFGYSLNEAVGKNLSILMPENHARLHDNYLEEYRKAGNSAIMGKIRELQGRTKDGREFPIELTVTELRLGRYRFYTGIIRDITDRKRAEAVERRYTEELEAQVDERTRDLRRLSRQTQGILDSAGDGIVGLNMKGEVIFANPAAVSTLGWAEVGMARTTAAEVFRFGDDARRRRPVPVLEELQRGSGHARTEVTLLRRDGSTFEAEYAASPIDVDGEQVGAVVVLRDITERKAAEARLSVAHTVFQNTAEGVLVCDSNGLITMVNPACAVITGWAVADVMGQAAQNILFPENPELWSELALGLAQTQHWEHEYWSTRRDGSDYAARLVASLVPDSKGETRQIALVLNDITQRKRDEEHIRYQASYDMLTGLPNRAQFNERLAQAVEQAQRTGHAVALMFIDLDGFKKVNDTLGHDAGDVLLKGAANRLRDCVRERDTVARLGGDEFTVIMYGLESKNTAAMVADRIIQSLTVPFDLADNQGEAQEGRVSASIGIAMLPEHAEDAEELLRRADAAMYYAKGQGKANFQFFDPVVMNGG